MAQAMNVPFELYGVFHIVLILRYLLSGCWPASGRAWERDASGFAETVHAIMDLGFTEVSDSSRVAFSVVFIALAALVIVWHIVVWQSYVATHVFSPFQLFLTRVIHQCFIPLCLPTYAAMVGTYLRNALAGAMSAEGAPALDSALLAFTLFAGIAMCVLFFVSFGFACYSPVLMYQAIHCSWDPMPTFIAIGAQLWCSLCAPVLDLFASWLGVIFVGMEIIVLVFICSQMQYFPFHGMVQNIAFVGVSAGSCTMQICVILRMLAMEVPLGVSLPLYLGMIVVVTIIAGISFTRYRKRIVAELSYSSIDTGDARPTEVEKRSYFETLHFSSDKAVIAYLRIGLAEGCDLLLDFSFLHYVSETYKSPDVTFAVAEMLSFFPTELQFFGGCLATIQRYGRLSLFDHFLLFQMRRIFVMRQSSLSKEASSMIRRVRHKAHDARSAFRSVWVETVKHPDSLTFGVLREMQRLMHRINGELRDLADRYANNQDVCNEYASFLIEGYGEFMEGFKWKARAQLIEQGVRLDTDFAFRALMNCYPHFLLRNIFDDRGNYLLARENRKASGMASQSSQSSAAFLSSGSQTSRADLQPNALEEVGQTAIHESTLRIAVESALDVMPFPSLRALQISMALVHSVAFLIGVVVMIVGVTIDNSATDYLAQLERLTATNEYMAETILTGGIGMGLDSWFTAFDGLTQLKRDTGIASGDRLHYLNDMEFLIWRKSRLARRSFLELMTHLLDSRDMYPLSTQLCASDIRQMSWAMVPALKNMTGHGVVIDDLDRIALAVSWSGTDAYNLTYDLHLLGWVRWFEGMAGLAMEVPWLAELRSAIVEDGRALFHGYRSAIAVAEYLVPIVAGICFLALVIWSIHNFTRSLARALDMLRGVKQDVVERSLLPISKGVKRERMNNGSSQLPKGSDVLVAVLSIDCVFSVVVDCIAFAGAFMLATTDLDQIQWLLDWYVLAERRMTKVTTIPGMIATIGSTPEGPPDIPFHLWVFESIENSLAELDQSRTVLLVGDEETGLPPVTGFDVELDRAELADSCSSSPDDLYDLFSCMSTDRSCAQVSILTRKIIQESDPERRCHITHCGRMPSNGPDFSMLFLVVDGLAGKLFEYGEILLGFAQDRFSSVTSTLVLFGGIILILNIVTFAIVSLIIVQTRHALTSLKALLRLLPPRDLLADTKLVQLISGDDTSSEAILTPAEVVMERSSEGIVSLSLDYSIESVNPAFQTVTGLSADESLGQRLSTVFPPGDSTKELYDQLEQLRSGGATSVETVTIRCENSLGVPLEVAIVIVPHFDADGTILSFSLLLQDLSREAAGESKRKEVRMRCERIIQTLMPIEVYAGLSSGSSVFSSISATVLSVEITGFLDNVVSYAPSQILEAISCVYDLFDEIATVHACVRRVIYGANEILGCCGLFDFMDQPDEQVEAAALTCLEFLSHREEISEKLAIEMDIKCGIAFGGPLIGDVLDKESPRFNLAGPIVDEAIRIRENAPPGAVHVSAGVQGLLKPYMFDFQAVQVPGRKVSGVFKIEMKAV
jgi:PAS domain S-box-containing protein